MITNVARVSLGRLNAEQLKLLLDASTKTHIEDSPRFDAIAAGLAISKTELFRDLGEWGELARRALYDQKLNPVAGDDAPTRASNADMFPGMTAAAGPEKVREAKTWGGERIRVGDRAWFRAHPREMGEPANVIELTRSGPNTTEVDDVMAKLSNGRDVHLSNLTTTTPVERAKQLLREGVSDEQRAELNAFLKENT